MHELQQLRSKQHHVSDDQILDLDCEWGGEEMRGGKTVCSLAGHFQTSSIGAKWSFLITFIFLLKLQRHKKLLSAGVIHMFLEAAAQAIPPWHCGCCLLTELGFSSYRLIS